MGGWRTAKWIRAGAIALSAVAHGAAAILLLSAPNTALKRPGEIATEVSLEALSLSGDAVAMPTEPASARTVPQTLPPQAMAETAPGEVIPAEPLSLEGEALDSGPEDIPIAERQTPPSTTDPATLVQASPPDEEVTQAMPDSVEAAPAQLPTPDDRPTTEIASATPTPVPATPTPVPAAPPDVPLEIAPAAPDAEANVAVPAPAAVTDAPSTVSANLSLPELRAASQAPIKVAPRKAEPAAPKAASRRSSTSPKRLQRTPQASVARDGNGPAGTTSASPASRGKAASVDPGAETRYLSSLASQVRARQSFLANAPSGTVGLHFVLGPSGNLLSRRISRSSGSAALDAAALRMLEGAEPFPPFPKGVDIPRLSVDVPLSFGRR